jgi:hypothetical protein
LCLIFTIWPLAAGADSIGACNFDRSTLSFEGTPVEQALCLLRPVAKWGHVGSTLNNLPPTLAGKIGKPVDVSAATLRKHLDALRLVPASVGGSLDVPISRVRYFVIHDTSAPWFGDEPFPANIDSDPGLNNLSRYARPDAVAHLFINRKGDSLQGHDLSTPWRATKLETTVIGISAKGLFLHVELVQPRRRDASGGPKNDAIAPTPGFTDAQYERLALAYVICSVRTGTWLVPSFHATLDEGLPDAHDDPQNFDLARFDTAVSRLLEALSDDS